LLKTKKDKKIKVEEVEASTRSFPLLQISDRDVSATSESKVTLMPVSAYEVGSLKHYDIDITPLDESDQWSLRVVNMSDDEKYKERLSSVLSILPSLANFPDLQIVFHHKIRGNSHLLAVLACFYPTADAYYTGSLTMLGDGVYGESMQD
jgi:hypothetical protein